ncbi:MAG: rRNA maturation RNase YbeY [Planctomycetota bacterium]|jgi:probable rRNA maturation factor
MSPAKKEQDIVVQIAKNFDGLDVNFPRLRKLVKTMCSRFELVKATVGVAIVNDAEIKRLNKQFLSRNATTDCLSFDLSDDQDRLAKRRVRKRQEKNVPVPGRIAAKIFELVVNGEMAVKEATVRGHSGEAELALYVVHGLLHNLGFDDSTQAQAKKMHDTEDKILQELGYGLVYNKGKRAQEQKKPGTDITRSARKK